MLQLLGIEGIPEIRPGDDLAGRIRSAAARVGAEPADGDVLVVCQKVVSKAEGRLVRTDRIEPTKAAAAWALENRRDPAEVHTVLAEAQRVVRTAGPVLITETRHGFVCANSGVDRSNAPPGTLCLLPVDPDRSARELAGRLSGESANEGVKVGVILTDTWGRPFRLGAVEVAIGVAGVPALLDYRGQQDPAGRTLGRTLRSSTIAVADELAAAAGLLMGKLRRIPAVLVRGVPALVGDGPPGTGADLLRDRGEDFFR